MRKLSIRNINDVDILTYVKISSFIRFYEEELKYPGYSVFKLNDVPKKNYGYIVNILTAQLDHKLIKAMKMNRHLMVIARYTDEETFKEYLAEKGIKGGVYSYQTYVENYEKTLTEYIESVEKKIKEEGTPEKVYEKALIDAAKQVLKEEFDSTVHSSVKRRVITQKVNKATREYNLGMQEINLVEQKLKSDQMSEEERKKCIKETYDSFKYDYWRTFEDRFHKISSKMSRNIYHYYIMVDGGRVYTEEWVRFLFKIFLKDANIFEINQIMQRIKKTKMITEKDWLETVLMDRSVFSAYILYIKGNISPKQILGSDAERVEKTYQKYAENKASFNTYMNAEYLQEDFECNGGKTEDDWCIKPIYERNYLKEYRFFSDLRDSIIKVEKFMASEETQEWCKQSKEVKDFVETVSNNLKAFRDEKYLVKWSYLYSQD